MFLNICGKTIEKMFKGSVSFVDHFCYLYFMFIVVMLSCLFFACWDSADL